ncbi:MAG TPA: hypothetical protein VK978_05265 [Candidatus Saccharimonadales bacterium]|nr:hypothetical protein [Candidatus Saccharimonadales bacterium]
MEHDEWCSESLYMRRSARRTVAAGLLGYLFTGAMLVGHSTADVSPQEEPSRNQASGSEQIRVMYYDDLPVSPSRRPAGYLKSIDDVSCVVNAYRAEDPSSTAQAALPEYYGVSGTDTSGDFVVGFVDAHVDTGLDGPVPECR